MNLILIRCTYSNEKVVKKIALNLFLLCYNGKTMNLAIRTMQKPDIRQVEEIDRQAFPTLETSVSYRRELKNSIARYIVAYEPNGHTEDHAVKGHKSLLKRTLDKIGLLLLGEASTKDKIVGFAGVWFLAGEAHLITFAVRDGYRGAHIGEYLLCAVLDTAIKFRASLVTLEVRLSNITAQRLYQKYGFTQRGYRKNYYSDTKESALIMTNDSINKKDFRTRLANMKKHINDNFYPI